MLTYSLRRSFAFFNNKISTKYGEKCCRYNQNGLPMPKEKAVQTSEALKTFLDGWKLNPEHTKLQKIFYCQDYLMAVQFVKDIAKMDALTHKNCPSFILKGGDFLKIELYSPSLDGLSQVDFQLAMEINRMKFGEYFLQPVESEKNYRREAKLKSRARESEEIQKRLEADFNSKNTSQST